MALHCARLASVSLAVLLTAACSNGAPGTQQSPSAVGRMDSGDATSSANATDAGRRDPSDPTVIEIPTWITGLGIVNEASADERCRWSVSYPQVPDASSLNQDLRKDADYWLAQIRDGDVNCSEDSGIPGVHVGFDFTAATGNVIGVRVTTTLSGSAGDGESRKTYWYDGITRRSGSADRLIAPEQMTAFATELKNLLGGRPGVEQEQLTAVLAGPDRSVLTDIAFDSGGDLIVAVPEGTIGSGAAGRIVVQVPASAAKPLLSDLGRRAQVQATSPASTLALPGASAKPATATPTAPSTPDTNNPAPDCTRVKCVALTFDDGPGRYTAQLLRDLAAYNARATFFTVGQNVAIYPSLVRAEVQAGHEIGNHTWSHVDLSTASPAVIVRQIRKTDQIITKITGSAPTLIRPPYGAISGQVRANVDRPLVLWDVDTLDWKYHDSARVTRSAITGIQPGDIVLMHDIHATTVAAVPAILKSLSKRGFHFVTVSQLMAGEKLSAGKSFGANGNAFGRDR